MNYEAVVNLKWITMYESFLFLFLFLILRRMYDGHLTQPKKEN